MDSHYLGVFYLLYSDFLFWLNNNDVVLSSGIKDNWTAQRHLDYIEGIFSNSSITNDSVSFNAIIGNSCIKK